MRSILNNTFLLTRNHTIWIQKFCLIHLAPSCTFRSCSSSSGIFLVSIILFFELKNKFLYLLVKWPIFHILQLLLLKNLILAALGFWNLCCLLIRRLTIFDFLLCWRQIFIYLLMSCPCSNSTWWWLSI